MSDPVYFKSGWKVVAEFPESEPIISMTTWQDRVVVATTRRVYWVIDGVVKPMPIEVEDDQ